jgi:hypothetical protein
MCPIRLRRQFGRPRQVRGRGRGVTMSRAMSNESARISRSSEIKSGVIIPTSHKCLACVKDCSSSIRTAQYLPEGSTLA